MQKVAGDVRLEAARTNIGCAKQNFKEWQAQLQPEGKLGQGLLDFLVRTFMGPTPRVDFPVLSESATALDMSALDAWANNLD